MVEKNRKVVDLLFTNLLILYQSRISIVFQSELEGKQFFLYLKSSDFDFECKNNFSYNKRQLLKTTLHFEKLLKNLMMEFRHVLINKILKKLLPNRLVDHKLELVLGIQPPSKAPYRLNQVELSEFKKQLSDLLKKMYIRQKNLHLVLQSFL